MTKEHTPTPWTMHKREDEEAATLIKFIGENDDELVEALKDLSMTLFIGGNTTNFLDKAREVLKKAGAL